MFFFSTQLWPILISFFLFITYCSPGPGADAFAVQSFLSDSAVHTITTVAHVVRTVPKHPGGVPVARSSDVSASRCCAFTQLVNGSHHRTWVDPRAIHNSWPAFGKNPEFLRKPISRKLFGRRLSPTRDRRSQTHYIDDNSSLFMTSEDNPCTDSFWRQKTNNHVGTRF